MPALPAIGEARMSEIGTYFEVMMIHLSGTHAGEGSSRLSLLSMPRMGRLYFVLYLNANTVNIPFYISTLLSTPASSYFILESDVDQQRCT